MLILICSKKKHYLTLMHSNALETLEKDPSDTHKVSSLEEVSYIKNNFTLNPREISVVKKEKKKSDFLSLRPMFRNLIKNFCDW